MINLSQGGRSLGKILSGAFGVQEITATDPGIQRLAAIRSGEYAGVGTVNISAQSEVNQLLGIEQDKLGALTRAGVFDEKTGLDTIVQPLANALFTAVVPGGGLILKAGQTYVAAQNQEAAFQPKPQPQEDRKMAFQDGDTSFFPDFNLNSIFQGGLGQNLLNIGTQALSGYVGQQFAPQPVSYQTNMAVVPQAARAVAIVGRGFFQKFPNLATSIQALRNAGKNVTRAKLYSALKRFGPEMLVSGGLLTAAAVSELAVAGPGHRRMNAGNVKALRKAHRRMESFHRICQKNDVLRSKGRKKR
jgi:hypothetical protein